MAPLQSLSSPSPQTSRSARRTQAQTEKPSVVGAQPQLSARGQPPSSLHDALQIPSPSSTRTHKEDAQSSVALQGSPRRLLPPGGALEESGPQPTSNSSTAKATRHDAIASRVIMAPQP
jgi:hypothetical protein